MGQAPRTVPDYSKHLKKSLVLTFRNKVGEYQPPPKSHQITTDMKNKTKPKSKPKDKKPTAYFDADTLRCPITGLKKERY